MTGRYLYVGYYCGYDDYAGMSAGTVGNAASKSSFAIGASLSYLGGPVNAA